MAYFLKKTCLKGRTYLSIVESFYDGTKKGTAHKIYKSLSSVETLKEKGLEDPIAYYQAEVDKLNKEREIKKVEFISEESTTRYLGYFLAKAVLNKLDVKNVFALFNATTHFEFDLYDVFSSLVFSRLVKPCSKHKTFHEVLPYLGTKVNYTYYQLLEALKFYGSNYKKIVELFTRATNEKYSLNTSTTYFDCTNFYFEIDREDDFRKKGPSKENRKCPIVGLGLLLDSNQIPIGMRMYPGNESEKPVLREIISELKEQNNISGKTIHVADKGLNCAKNIYAAKKNGDGYIFSKSVKTLPETEEAWILLNNDYKAVKDKENHVVFYYKSCIDKFPYNYTDENGKVHRFTLTEKRLVTYNPLLARKKCFEIVRMVEKAKRLCASKAKRDEYGDSSRYVDFKGADGSSAKASINDEKIARDKKLAGFNIIVTSETTMKDRDIYDVYHNLWRIEESFRIMKNDLDARPVYLQTEEAIKGHFLICFVAVLLERILQFNVFENKYSSNDFYKFFKEFKVTKGKKDYTNTTTDTPFIKEMAAYTNLPLKNLYLSPAQFERILNYNFN